METATTMPLIAPSDDTHAHEHESSARVPSCLRKPNKAGKPPVEVTMEREHQAWLLKMRDHLSYRKIGEKLNITHANAFHAVKRRQAQLHAIYHVEAREIMEEHTAQLESIIGEAWTDYRADKGPQKTVRVVSRPARTDAEKARAGKRGWVSTRIVEEMWPGRANAALVAQARGALADLRQIWGAAASQVNAATRVVAEEDGMPAGHEILVGMFADGFKETMKAFFGDLDPAFAPDAHAELVPALADALGTPVVVCPTFL